MLICEKEKCTGCFACINVCPSHCIQMIEEDKGHIYPEIDMDKCIRCNKCQNVCQANQVKSLSTPKVCYLAWSKSNNIRKSSTSGGIAYELSLEAFQKKYSVFGAVINESYGVEHRKISLIEDIQKLQGSKYVHSYTNSTFCSVQQELEADRGVLYIGTPCQVAGLKIFLKKEYSKLITCDLICHGVPSQKCLQENAKEILKIDSLEGFKFTFRDSIDHGLNYKIYKNSEVMYDHPFYKNLFYLAFEMNLLQRKCCYKCEYARLERCGDITLGDFWGVEEIDVAEKRKGLSLVLGNSQQGIDFLNEIQNKVVLQKRDIQEAIKGNAHLSSPVIKPKNEERFSMRYRNHSLKKSLKPFLIPYILKYKFLYGIVLKTPFKKIIH